MISLTRICAAAAILVTLLATDVAAEPQRVLLLHSYGPQFGPWNFYAARFREELLKQSPNEIDLYEVYLQSARFTETEDQEPIIQYARSLFAGHKLDLIVSIGAPAAKFAQRFRPQFFPSTPLVIGAAERRAVDEIGLTANDTYVPSTLNFNAWVENILQVLPDTKHIAWAVGASPLERFWNEYFHRVSEPFRDRVTFEWFEALTFDQMLKRVAELPPHSAILYVDLRVDAAGAPLDSARAFERLYAEAHAPIFSYLDAYFGRGNVGGPLRSSAEMGRRIASAVVRILGGESPGNIKLEPLAEGTPTYDWRELQRWSISESRLLRGSEIHFREPGAWERYHREILIFVAVLLLQTSLIAWLIYEHRRRHVAEITARGAVSDLMHMNRIATAGELSGAIAHEISQPLAVISVRAGTALNWLKSKTLDLDEMRASLTAISHETQRAGRIVQNVRAMFRKDTQESAQVDINRVILAVFDLMRIELQKCNIKVFTELGDQLPPTNGREVQLQQVVFNLVMNAKEAMQAIPTVRELRIRSKLNEAGQIQVSIEDSGTGISASDIQRVFDPAFTTKANGMGMGLSICRTIIEDHGGRIWATQGNPTGSNFSFSLPAS